MPSPTQTGWYPWFFDCTASEIASTELGGYLATPHSFLAMTRRSTYVDQHAHPGQEGKRTTVNPASLLGLTDRGTMAPGQRADLVLLRHNDERMLAYEVGGNPVDSVISAGRLV